MYLKCRSRKTDVQVLAETHICFLSWFESLLNKFKSEITVSSQEFFKLKTLDIIKCKESWKEIFLHLPCNVCITFSLPRNYTSCVIFEGGS